MIFQQKKKNKKTRMILIIALIAGLILIAFAYWDYLNNSQKKDSSIKINQVNNDQYISVQQLIIFDKDNIKKNNVLINKEATAFDLLRQTARIKTDTKNQSDEIISIENLVPKTDQAWAFYVNDKKINQPASAYVLKPEDVIKWQIEKAKK